MRRHGRATSVNFHAMATCLPIRCEWLISIGERMSIEMQSTNLWSSSVPRLQANSFPLSLLFCLRFLHHPPLSFLTEISGDCPLASRLTLCFSLYFWIFAIRLAYFSNLKKKTKKMQQSCTWTRAWLLWAIKCGSLTFWGYRLICSLSES